MNQLEFDINQQEISLKVRQCRGCVCVCVFVAHSVSVYVCLSVSLQSRMCSDWKPESLKSPDSSLLSSAEPFKVTLFEVKDRIAYITLNRPGERQPLSVRVVALSHH